MPLSSERIRVEAPYPAAPLRRRVTLNLVRQLAYHFVSRFKAEEIAGFTTSFEAWKAAPHGTGEADAVGELCSLILRQLESGDGTRPEQGLDTRSTAYPDESALELTGDLIRNWGAAGDALGQEVNERLTRSRYQIVATGGGGFDGDFDRHDIIGSDDSWRETMEMARLAATCDFPVLIIGETGVGKEMVARCIHRNSSRGAGPCITINCAALPESLVESELFGYHGGAFTGASKAGKRGRVESAAGGTLVLDDITELNPHAQGALLRVLQNGEIQKLGGQSSTVDFRLIAISNQPIESFVESGRFRRDLYYRITVVPIHLPPLRQRARDILPLAQNFVSIYASQLNGGAPPKITEAAAAALVRHQWPGNVRELENVMARSLVLGKGGDIGPGHLIFDTSGPARLDEARRLSGRIATSGALSGFMVNFDEIARFILASPERVISSAYSLRFRCGQGTARRHLDALRLAGIMTRFGAKRGTYYRLSND